MPSWGFVWLVAWPDFRARLPRFLVIGTGMALVLSITLLLSAFSEGFELRATRLLDGFGGNEFVVAAGGAGPMSSTTPFPASALANVAAMDGVERATGLFLQPNAVLVDGAPAGVVVVGTGGDDHSFELIAGRDLAAPGEALVDVELVELELDDTFVLAGRPFTVVGTTEYATWDIANAAIFIDRKDSLDLLAGGQDVVTAIAVDGSVDGSLPDGLTVVSRQAAFDDLLSRTAAAKRSIDSFKITLWILAVVIVGAVLYLAAIERVRDFAIFKATGAGNVDLVVGLSLQAVIVGVISGILSIGLAHLLKPVYPGLLSLPLRIAWLVIPIAVIIAVAASFVGVRRAIRVDPSQAFG